MDSSSRDAHAARVAEVFRKHDRDASGTMDAGELEAALAELGALPKAGDAKLGRPTTNAPGPTRC